MSTETQTNETQAEEDAGVTQTNAEGEQVEQTELGLETNDDAEKAALAAKAKADDERRIAAEVQKRVKKELEAARKEEAAKRQKDEERAKLDLAERLKIEKAEADALAKEAKAEADEARRNLMLYREMSSARFSPVKEAATPMLEKAFGNLIAEGLDPTAAMKKLAETHDFLLVRHDVQQAAAAGATRSSASGPTQRTAARQAPQRDRPKPGATFEELAAYARASHSN